MRIPIFPIAIAASLIAGCSDGGSGQSQGSTVAAEAAAAADAAETAAAPAQQHGGAGVGWPAGEACAFLEPTLATRGYKHDFDDEYHCSSPYMDIGPSTPQLANNLAYYVTGGAETADTLKLVLNYNQPANAASATEQLVAASQHLSLEATGNDLPPAILSGLSAGRPIVEVSEGFRHEVKRDDWPTGRGYETHYIVTRSADRR